jgi:cytochrome c biogenesis protein CcmG/thiol:disulfide interchange protein DsbE
MKKTLSLAAVSILFVVLPWLLAADNPQYPRIIQKTLYADDIRGKPAPKFAVDQWLTDQPSRDGKVVIIDFWATWCPPCRATIPELNDYQKKFKDDLVVIGVSDETPAVLKDFMSKTEMKYSVATDPAGQMKNAINVKGIPHVLIISTDGIVRWQGFPLSDEEPLTDAIVKQVIDTDPGVAARHATR